MRAVLAGIRGPVVLGAQVQAQGFYERLGFTVVPGGKHPVGTHNALIAFNTSQFGPSQVAARETAVAANRT